MLKNKWWPFGLIIAGAIVLWLLGYRSPTDQGAITFMALVILGAGAYLIALEKRGGRRP